ncbi:O-antigen ligase family protein [Ammoniphilus sp. CFH 90114]|uniref:O-antigen ligase family protein n=1 Tax=Ammoniphilus sp. CFH 90114 TaxID=2493665 RepID=UPI0013E95789|nr:O-antigen ligase family protein [Ammoniphilus sp. CFH 90114]
MLPYIFSGMGVLLAIFALLAYYKLVDYRDAVLIDHLGNQRFTSVFQYGNTYAAVIGSFWLFNLSKLTDRENKVWQVIFFSFPLALFALNLMHTYSRGALLVFASVWMITLLCMPLSRQISFVFHSFLSTFGGLVLFRGLSIYSPITTLILMILFIILSSVFGILYMRYGWKLQKLDKWRLSRFYFMGVAVILAVLLFLDMKNEGFVYKQLPVSFQERVKDISLETYSVQGRSLFMDDALKISSENPILGVGGEGWRILFTHVQEVPYWSNETHNGYLEILLSTGWLGMSLFVGVFGYLFFQLIVQLRSSSKQESTLVVGTLSALLMLFLHSAIDFNFSYGTVWFVIMVLFAMGITTKNKKEKIEKTILIRSVLSLLTLAVAISGVYSLRMYSAENTFSSIQKGQVTESKVKALIDKNPYSVRYQEIAIDVYLQLYQQTKKASYMELAKGSLNRMIELEPRNARVMFNAGIFHYKLGDFEQATIYFDKVLEYDHFNTGYYENIIKMKNDMMQNTYQLDKEKAEIYANSLTNDFKLLNEWHERMKAYSFEINERNFHIPVGARVPVAQTKFFFKHFEEVIPLLQGVEGGDPNLMTQAQAMLAVSYMMIGEKEKSKKVYENMMKQVPNFKEYYNSYLELAKS